MIGYRCTGQPHVCVLAVLAVVLLPACGQVTITADKPPTFDELRGPQFVVGFSKKGEACMSDRGKRNRAGGL